MSSIILSREFLSLSNNPSYMKRKSAVPKVGPGRYTNTATQEVVVVVGGKEGSVCFRPEGGTVLQAKTMNTEVFAITHTPTPSTEPTEDPTHE